MDEQLDRLRAALAERYEIERKLGEGGMARVYLARDLKHDRRVAIKVLRPELAASLGAQRFLQEIRVTAKLNHPHILPLYDSGEASGFLYYVMPFVLGESLCDLLKRERQLPIDDAIRITIEVAEALAHAHGQGLVHRDIKPENILLSEGHAIVADFGISRAVSEAGGARLTQTGMAIGTPLYMSPEQSAGDPSVDGRSDIYSLACVLYQLVVGQVPFPAPTAQAMMARHSIDRVPPPSIQRPAIPPNLEDAILCALAKNPADRFKTATAFAAALAAVHTGGDGSVRATSADNGSALGWALAGKPSLRRALLFALGAVVLVIAGMVGWRLASSGVASADRPQPVTSIAVLPFDNVSDDPSNEYFGYGLADELVDVLSRIDGLRVAARRSTRAFKDTRASPRTIGRELGVQAILEGSVRKTGDRIRITARLVDAQDGLQLWSDRYDRTVGDVFAIQDEIAHSIVSALRGELQGELDVPSVEALTRDPMAHDKYLWGQFNLTRRNEEGAHDAINNFTMAIGFDSIFASAYAGLADAHLALLEHSAEAREPGTVEAARSAAESALRLNPALARARAALGLVKFNSFDWRGAEAEYVDALEANPEDPVVRERYAEMLASVGRVDDAVVHARVAVQQDRHSAAAWHTLLRVLRANGEYAEAIRAGQEMLQLNANQAEPWLDIGLLFLVEGRPEAADALERYAELRRGDAEAFRAFAMAAARYAQDKTVTPLPPGVVALMLESPVELAALHQLVGGEQEALSLLERAHRERNPDLTALTTRPELAPLQQEVRFRAILADLGLGSH